MQGANERLLRPIWRDITSYRRAEFEKESRINVTVEQLAQNNREEECGEIRDSTAVLEEMNDGAE